MKPLKPSYRDHKFPPEIISHAVWLYHRFDKPIRSRRPRGRLGESSTVTMTRYAQFDPDPPRRSSKLSVHVRRAMPGDAPAIAEIDCAREGGDPTDVVDQVRRSLQKGVAEVWVAEVEDAVSAFAKVQSLELESQEAIGPSRNVASGFYLMGVTVAESARRLGIGSALTSARLDWIASLGVNRAYCLISAENLASIALHSALGFEEVTRDIVYPGVPSSRGIRILFRVDLTRRLARETARG